MGANSHKTADDSSAMASSSTPSPGTQWKPTIPSDGWGSSLEKGKAEMDRYIGKSGKHIFRAIRNTAVLRHFVYRTNILGPYDLVFVQLAPAFNGWRPFWNKVYNRSPTKVTVYLHNKPHLLSVYRRNKPRERCWGKSTQIGRSLYK